MQNHNLSKHLHVYLRSNLNQITSMQKHFSTKKHILKNDINIIQLVKNLEEDVTFKNIFLNNKD